MTAPPNSFHTRRVVNQGFFLKLQKWMLNAAQWPVVPFILFLIAFTDFLILLIPSDFFLIAAVLGYQKRTPVFAAGMILGRSAAVVAAYFLAQHFPIEHLHGLAVSYGFESVWNQCQSFFEKFGPLSVAIAGLTPLPMLFPAVMSTVAGAALWQLFLFTLVGSIVRYSLLCVAVIGGKELYLKYFQEEK